MLGMAVAEQHDRRPGALGRRRRSSTGRRGPRLVRARRARSASAAPRVGVGVTTFASAGFEQGCAGSRAAAPKQSGTASRRARASTSPIWSSAPSQAETTDHLKRPNGRPASTGVNAAVRVFPSSVSVEAMRVALPGGSSGTRRRIGVPRRRGGDAQRGLRRAVAERQAQRARAAMVELLGLELAARLDRRAAARSRPGRARRTRGPAARPAGSPATRGRPAAGSMAAEEPRTRVRQPTPTGFRARAVPAPRRRAGAGARWRTVAVKNARDERTRPRRTAVLAHVARVRGVRRRPRASRRGPDRVLRGAVASSRWRCCSSAASGCSSTTRSSAGASCTAVFDNVPLSAGRRPRAAGAHRRRRARQHGPARADLGRAADRRRQRRDGRAAPRDQPGVGHPHAPAARCAARRSTSRSCSARPRCSSSRSRCRRTRERGGLARRRRLGARPGRRPAAVRLHDRRRALPLPRAPEPAPEDPRDLAGRGRRRRADQPRARRRWSSTSSTWPTSARSTARSAR